ncbi:DALR anticodon-binding domain-containing protein [Nonomuraea roseoviolacea]|uniref:Arginyl-tRNA synthetase n=1 Tax=Nonomuraea roseoviolacea subsp. carminata TaxID=160689 RepID=A0ABT1JW12_9ACTN|nr:DALR anticodon-binding domain-containing protein [Nonomuraea roseoviolacea]MCP2345426.1 arginyl-tRNA synthetase [Nonomuraea roseoviolacea subsp. carminata]
MTPEQRLAEVLGEAPAPEGTWEREAAYLSAAARRLGVPAAGLAARARAVEGVAAVEERPNGFLRIVVEVPGRLVETVGPLSLPDPWPDFPRTWDNPGFAVRYGHARAVAVRRRARDLGVPEEGFRAELLGDPRDRAVLRVLAELPGRLAKGDRMGGAWSAYAVRLAMAYHDAYELAPVLPVGDEEPAPLHTARVRLARAVADVLPGPDRL